MRNRLLQRLEDRVKGKKKKQRPVQSAMLPEKHMPKKGDMPISIWKRIKAKLDEFAYSNAYKAYYDNMYTEGPYGALINQPGYESLKKEIMEGSKYFEPTEEHYKKFNEPYEPTEKEIREGYDKIRKMQMGGAQQLPGGIATSLPGSDAIEFSGQTHDEGGIMMDDVTEVEDGETMDQVTMNKEGGTKKDYFFSSYLKKGGKSFADHHKDILAMGGKQDDINMLAKMQEKAAGRNPNNVRAKLGGVMKYNTGGTFNAQSEKAKKIIEILKANNYDVPEVSDLNNPDITYNQAYQGSGYYGDSDVDLSTDKNRQAFFNRNKSTLMKIDRDKDGKPDIETWEDFNPKTDTKFFQEGFNADMMSAFNNDPALVKAFEDANLSGDDLLQFGFYDSGDDADTGIDGQFGQYTWSRTSPLVKKVEEGPCEDPGCPEGQTFNPETCQCEGEEVPGEDPCPACPDGTTPARQPDGSCPCPEPEKGPEKDYSGALLGVAGMIPAVMAYNEQPDYMESPDLIAPGVVKAERIAKQHLDRVDFNDQIARNAADAQAVSKAIETSGGGPANISNMMAMYAKKQQGDREIKAQEARANIAVSNEEAMLDNKRKLMNAEAALDASKYNVQSSQNAQQTNAKNKMLVDEFNRGADAATKDRRLMAVQYGINTLASLHRDKLAYNAQSDYANAIDGQRNAYERFLNKDNQIVKGQDNPNAVVNNNTGEVEIKDEDKKRGGGYRKLKLLRRYGK